MEAFYYYYYIFDDNNLIFLVLHSILHTLKGSLFCRRCAEFHTANFTTRPHT